MGAYKEPNLFTNMTEKFFPSTVLFLKTAIIRQKIMHVTFEGPKKTLKLCLHGIFI